MGRSNKITLRCFFNHRRQPSPDFQNHRMIVRLWISGNVGFSLPLNRFDGTPAHEVQFMRTEDQRHQVAGRKEDVATLQKFGFELVERHRDVGDLQVTFEDFEIIFQQISEVFSSEVGIRGEGQEVPEVLCRMEEPHHLVVQESDLALVLRKHDVVGPGISVTQGHDLLFQHF